MYWAESSFHHPLVSGSVAGASPYPVMPSYPIQTPPVHSMYEGVPHSHTLMYGKTESSSSHYSVPSVQPYMPSSYQKKSGDCGCGKTDIGTYGPEKTHHSMHNSYSKMPSTKPNNPGMGAQPYQNLQPGMGSQPYSQYAQPGMGYSHIVNTLNQVWGSAIQSIAQPEIVAIVYATSTI